jgi:hypothetical protein
MRIVPDGQRAGGFNVAGAGGVNQRQEPQCIVIVFYESSVALRMRATMLDSSGWAGRMDSR